MTLAEQYRAYAAECLQTAQHVAEHGHLAHLMELAQKWHEMADKAEEREAGKVKG